MHPIAHKIVHAIKTMGLRNSLISRSRKQAIIRFASKFGLVYFGHVDQHDDEHHVIRGLTVSSSHQDDSYSVGSSEGYDVSLVDRYDVVSSPGKTERTHHWVIFEIDLHNGKDIPHIFLGAHNHTDSSYSRLFTSVGSLQPIPLGTFEKHSDEFIKRYSLFSAATQFIEAERLFTANVTRTIAAHFWPLAAEVFEGSLYIYSDSKTISTHLLETMFNNGIWLAKQLDEHYYSPT